VCSLPERRDLSYTSFIITLPSLVFVTDQSRFSFYSHRVGSIIDLLARPRVISELPR